MSPDPMPVHLAYQAAKDEPVAETNPMRATAGSFPFTPADILGPYYLPDSPKHGALQRYEDTAGSKLQSLVLTVVNKRGEPLPGAKVEVWLANPFGVYSGFADQGTAGQDWCRGQLTADSQGRAAFTFCRPGHYKISDTEERTAHVHLKVTPPGGTVLVTQLYFPDEAAANARDGWEPKNDPLLLLAPAGDDAWEFQVVVKTFH